MNSILLFMGIGMEEMLVIGLFVLVFFGAEKVPEFMKGLGKGVREFKNGLNKIGNLNEEEEPEPATTREEESKSLPTATVKREPHLEGSRTEHHPEGVKPEPDPEQNQD